MIDKWTLVHLAFWFVIGANYTWHGFPHPEALGITLGGAVLWEVIELLMEKYNIVSGRETVLNRWVSDIAIALVGAEIGMWWVA